MTSEYIKLSPKLYFILEFIALSPILIVISMLWILKSPIFTMIFFQLISLTFLPCFFIDVLLSKTDDAPTLESFSPKIMKYLRGQILKSLGLVLFIFLLVGYTYYFLYQIDPSLFLSIQIPLIPSFLNYLVVGLLLAGTNPWLEEWFWRVFLVRFYPDTEFWRLVCTFHYAIYHFFVLIALTKDWILSVMGLIGIFIMGRFFLWLRMNAGFMVSGMTHMASDICVVVMAIINLENRQNL